MAPKKKLKPGEEEKPRGGFLKAWQKKADIQRAFTKKRFGEEMTLYSGDPALDWGQGGFKRGRANLFFGPSKSGKTTIALILAGMEQKKTKGYVLVFDSEYAHKVDDPDAVERWEQAGIDPAKVISVSSNRVDALFEGLGDLEADIKKGELNISAIVVDSWGGVQSEQARDKLDAGNVSGAGNAFGGNAKTINPIIQSLLRICSEYGVTGFFVQHCIENLDKDQYGNPKGPKWILLGGQKLRYLCHGITFFESVEAKDALLGDGDSQIQRGDGNIAVGKKIRMRCEKSRKQVEGRKVEFWMNFAEARFARPAQSLFDLAVSLGVIDHPVVPELDEKTGEQKIDKKTKLPVVKINKGWWQFQASAEKVYKFQIKEFQAQLDTDAELYKTMFEACSNCSKKDAAPEWSASQADVGGDVPDAEDLKGLELPGDDDE